MWGSSKTDQNIQLSAQIATAPSMERATGVADAHRVLTVLIYIHTGSADWPSPTGTLRFRWI